MAFPSELISWPVVPLLLEFVPHFATQVFKLFAIVNVLSSNALFDKFVLMLVPHLSDIGLIAVAHNGSNLVESLRALLSKDHTPTVVIHLS